MIYVHWLVILAYTIIVVAAMLHVLMDNRQPAKTMAWVLVLSFMPLVGIVLYFFFGQNTPPAGRPGQCRSFVLIYSIEE